VCRGVFIVITGRDQLRPVRVGVEIASALARLYGQQFRLEDAATQMGSKDAIARIRSGDDPEAVVQSFAADERAWRETRARYLLY
jgi:uncharacterized protein YbbC (DUF1343 family)